MLINISLVIQFLNGRLFLTTLDSTQNSVHKDNKLFINTNSCVNHYNSINNGIFEYLLKVCVNMCPVDDTTSFS